MCPCLHNPHRLASLMHVAPWAQLLVLLEPLRKLKRQQLAKQAPHTNAGVVIASAPDNVLFSFVISTIWTIQGQLREARECNDARVTYLSRNSSAELVQ